MLGGKSSPSSTGYSKSFAQLGLPLIDQARLLTFDPSDISTLFLFNSLFSNSYQPTQNSHIPTINIFHKHA